MIADIRVVRDCGQYTEGPSGLSVRVWDYGEEINEIFVYDQEVPVFPCTPRLS
jgi:glycyl-tRNA synthetase alpha subunit